MMRIALFLLTNLAVIAGTPIEAGPFDTVVLFKINYN